MGTAVPDVDDHFLWRVAGVETPGAGGMQFDPRGLNFTLLTLMLSLLQASYTFPLLLLAEPSGG